MSRSAVRNAQTTTDGHNRIRRRRSRGLSLVEMLISLAITAMLLTATMVAIDASFKAYAAAVETASTQTATRMVVNRILTLMRTSTAHGPLTQEDITEAGIAFDYTVENFYTNPIESSFIIMFDDQGDEVRLYYRADLQELWLQKQDNTGKWQDHPLLSGVTVCTFYLHHRLDSVGGPVLDRGTLDLQVKADDDNTLAIEGDALPPIRVIASTMPRRLN